MKRHPPKTPMQMRLEANPPRPQPLAPRPSIDPASRPPLYAQDINEIDATREWLAHLAAGRIAVR